MVYFIRIILIDCQPPYLYYIPIKLIGKYQETFYEINRNKISTGSNRTLLTGNSCKWFFIYLRTNSLFYLGVATASLPPGFAHFRYRFILCFAKYACGGAPIPNAVSSQVRINLHSSKRILCCRRKSRGLCKI